MLSTDPQTSSAVFPAGSGPMAEAMRSHDWRGSTLGPPADWPVALKVAVNLMLDSPESMFIAWGPDLSFLFNDAFRPLLGPRQPHALGQPLRELWFDAWDQVRPIIEKALAGTGSRFENLPLTLSRPGWEEQTWWTFSYSPLRDENGAVVGMLGVANETTERILAERHQAVLDESERRYRTLFNAMDEGFCIIEFIDGPHGPLSDYIHIEANPAYAVHAGIPNVVGQKVRDMVGAEAEGWIKLYYGVLQTGRPIRFERELEATGRWLELSAFRVEPADRNQVAVLFQDLTGKKRAEAALRELNETLEARVADRSAERDRLWRLSEDMLARADYSGMMSAVSPAWTRVLGWTENELLTRPYATFMHPEDMAPTLAAIQKMSATGEPARFENRIATANGGWKPIEWTVAPEPDDINFIAVGRDLSATKEREAELRTLEEALRQSQKMEAVGQLTGGLAHDFNNLLAGISGSLELLQTRILQGRYADVDRYVLAAQGASKRAAALTHRLLAFSRRQTLDPKTININTLVAGMEELIRRTIGPAISMETVAGIGVWNIHVDPNQLENALLNLAINARDAMPEGGKLTIETANRWLDERAARQRDLTPGQYVSMCVSDNGVGMSPEVAAKAFDPFFTTKPIGVGTGLGLSMIYGFARQSGGQVRIYSEVGKGTMVCIYLPRHLGDADPASAEPADAQFGQAQNGETVLIIDDEPLVRMLVVDTLEDLGYLAIEAADGVAGVKVLQSDQRIDLLITDVGLPNGMNGRQVADAARQLRPGLKVLFITGFAENAVLNHGHLEHGMHVVTKPFEIADLSRRIRAIILEPST